jgi:hypothetical protein
MQSVTIKFPEYNFPQKLKFKGQLYTKQGEGYFPKNFKIEKPPAYKLTYPPKTQPTLTIMTNNNVFKNCIFTIYYEHSSYANRF